MKIIKIDSVQVIHLSGTKSFFSETNQCLYGKYKSLDAVNDSSLEITDYIKYLFRNNDFNWDVEKIGRALAHYKIWRATAKSKKVKTVLILENDVVIDPNFIEKWNIMSEHMSFEAGIIYLGGVSNDNKINLDTVSEQINTSFAIIKANNNKIHFDACSYIITKKAAKKICSLIDVLGFQMCVDKMLLNMDSLFAIHFSTPLLCNRLPSEKNVLNKYQIILISTSVERKNKIIEQFNELNIHAQLICFENPSIVTNLTDYFPENIFESDKNIVCCTRDHIRALELSAKDESPEFSIIIEDDVAFHKTKFIDGINEIMNNWAKITEPTSAKMVSIGLVPSCKYDDYSKQSPKYTLESIQDTKILGDIYEIGTTAYIVRKCDMKTQTALFGHNTLDSLRNTINLMKRNGLETVDCISGDYFINKALNQVFVFPPLVIEQDIKTALCDDMRYWINLYYGREDYIKDFCSF